MNFFCKLAITLILTLQVTMAGFAEDKSPSLNIDFESLEENLPVILKGASIGIRAMQRYNDYKANLRNQGYEELPPDDGDLYKIDVPGDLSFSFDNRGELSIDKRFINKEELTVLQQIERLIRKWFPSLTKERKVPRRHGGKAGLPVFKGFENPRYQKHDELVAKLVSEFNADKAKWAGSTKQQAKSIPDLQPALVKSQMIEEAGGRGPRSLLAWHADPLQVNVPGDWGKEKEDVGLSKPQTRNEGTLEQNIRSGIMYLARKGFSSAACAAKTKPKKNFDGWRTALQRYNGRQDKTASDKLYSAEYAEKIIKRADNPDSFVPIKIKLAR